MLAIVISSAATRAQERTDLLAEAYTQLYEGQPEEAHAQFARLRTQNHEALAPWFGSLFVMMARMDHDDSLEATFEPSIDAFIDRASKRHTRSVEDAEAQFYLAQAYLLRSTYRFRFEKGVWGAARDAARSKGYAEDFIKRHPDYGDAYVALGLYNYSVDVAPSLVKFLRVLLLLPSGSRAKGLEQLERARTEGRLFAPFADAALASIYGAFEGRPDHAIPRLARLVQRFPGNAELRLELASMYLHPTVEDFAHAEQQYQAVRLSAGTSMPRHVAERHSAILGLASVRRNQWRIDDAIALLDPPIDGRPATPRWVMPSLLLRRANYKMLVNDPTAADDARRVLSDPKLEDWHEAARRQLTAIESRRRGNEGSVYAALLPGNRLVADDRFAEARAAYDAVAENHPGDWQVRYRLAYLEFARARYEAAAAAMQAIVDTRSPMPAWLKAAALLHLGWVRDIQGDRAQALKLYRRIVDDYDDETPAMAARRGLIAPYQVPKVPQVPSVPKAPSS